ncbi:adenosylcobinamide-GDP ribazoletransferase [Spirulina major]|uniref:adenosylcobinamide-GDP ribazoletransferase n=1 Tax=Spirulina major TaxID=270636 RepID=UPI0009345C70|nr:adenosylcobinamide-GDP ribazoletransferase [Spirulina major]
MFKKFFWSFSSALVFYTRLPLPPHWPLRFERIARWAPLIGIVLGWGLGAIDWGLMQGGLSSLLRAIALALLWVWWTGGLHLDGAMDTADGLAVLDPERRLAVMRDSAAGAFGVMAAIAILALKTAALVEFANPGFAIAAVAGWGRWGQGVAIAAYPYLRPTGKGAIHKTHQKLPQDVLLGLVCLLSLAALHISLHREKYIIILLGHGFLAVLTVGIGSWLARQFQGHTGDTYGAVVEWTEALGLVGLTMLWT